MRRLLFCCLLFSLVSFSGVANGLYFLENKGQVRDQYGNARTDIDYVLHDNGLGIFIGRGAIHYQFNREKAGQVKESVITARDFDTYRMDVTLLGANKYAKATAEKKHRYYERYHIPTTGAEGVIAHTWKKITYKEVYPGIDWVIYVKDGQAEYEFEVHEGGNPTDIQIQYNGASSLHINTDGSLTAATPMGDVTEAAPYCYTRNKEKVNSSFKLNGNVLTFDIDSYDGPLVIDPKLTWGTYFGGNAGASVYSVADDEGGYIYITGFTSSVSNIATTGSYQQTIAAANNAFLVQFDTSGARIWGTYYGGSVGEGAQDVSVDASGDIYIGGTAASPAAVATSGSYQEFFGGGPQDGFLAKFDSSGALLWATYFGGPEDDAVLSITSDNLGNVFIAGRTTSATGIADLGSFQPLIAGLHDCFLAKFNASGSLQWSTYYGGTSGEQANDLCTDNSGNVYMCGITSSAMNIATVGSHQPAPANAGGDNFLVKFNGLGQRLWGTYYGGSAAEQPCSVIHDGLGHVYLGGHTTSDTGIATPGSYQPGINLLGGTDAFIAQFNESGVRQWATYYGGQGSDGLSGLNGGRGITCDGAGNIFITGMTASDSGIATTCTHQETRSGFSNDFFLVKMDGTGSRLWGTYYGGPGNDGAGACTYYGGSIYIAGYQTTSTTGIATPGSFDEVYGAGNGLLARFDDCEVPGQPLGISGLTIVCEGDTVTYSIDTTCNAVDYTWMLPIGWSGNSNTNTITVSAVGSGIISVAANSACGSSTAQALAVVVNPAPVPVITESGNLLSTGNYSSYLWQFYGAPIAGATSQTYLTTQGGHYTVTVIDSNGCTGTSAVLPLSIAGRENNNDIALYPNPVIDELYIDGLREQTSYRLLNITGVTAMEGVLQQGKAVIDARALAPGLYILQMENGLRLKVLKK